MKKLFLIGGALLIVVIVAVGVFLYNSIDPIVKGAVEKYGEAITGTDVSVSSVDISLKSGRGTIRGIKVANPDGFPSGEAFHLGEIAIDIDVASLSKDPIVIQTVHISAPDVHAVLDAAAKSNIGVIKEHVDRYQAGSRGVRAEGRSFEKRFRIDSFTFEEGHVDVDATALGGAMRETGLPPLRLTHVGGTDGSAPDVIGKEIARAFLDAARDAVRAEVRDKIKDEAGKALEKVFN